MGFAYLTGDAVPPDGFKAAEFFRAGAERGDAFAAEELGRCYRRGDCLLRTDFTAACEWLFVARALGNGPTCDAYIQSHLSPSQIQEARQRAERFLSLYGELHHFIVKRSDWATSP
jgi:TPR repeat protein